MNRKILGWLLLSASVLLGSSALAQTSDSKEMNPEVRISTTQSIPVALDINSASAMEIAKVLKGVGVKKAQAIVTYRDALGGFKRIEQLLDVKGIGEAILARNRSLIKLPK